MASPFFRLRSPPAHCARPPSACCLRFLLLVGALLLPGLAGAQDYAAKGFKIGPTSPRESSDEERAAGKALYQDRCSQCHGDDGGGDGCRYVRSF